MSQTFLFNSRKVVLHEFLPFRFDFLDELLLLDTAIEALDKGFPAPREN